jgi:serine protease Do
VKHVLVVALCALLLASPRLSAQVGEHLMRENVTDFRSIVQHAKGQVFPAVVYIKVLVESNQGGKKQTMEASGSGVIISADGKVVTNWHVIDNAVEVRCLLTDGSHYDATILGSDQDTDLALLQLKIDETTGPLAYAHFGDSSALLEGDFVMAMGAPWGLNRSVSIGIISCTRRFLEGVSEYSLYLQTDAAINPGNSGGPLVNTLGEIVGINSRGMDAGDNLGFAIPSETVVLLVDQLERFGKMNWSWTGLQLQPLRDFNRNTYFDADEGVIVAATDPESPARLAGVQQRDRIVSVNGQTVDAVTAEDLPAVRRYIGLLPKHEVAAFVVDRGGEMIEIEITPREKGRVEGEEIALKRWDMSVKEINQFDNPALYFHRKAGVFIYGVTWPGNAANAGLQANDIIVSIDNRDVESLEDITAIHKELVANIGKKDKIMFRLLRGGLMKLVVLDFSRDYDRR